MLMRIENTPRPYAWGSRDLLAQLQGREPSGAPEAEIWFGDHPESPARLGEGSDAQSWNTWRDQHGDEQGITRPLPYLVKLLGVDAPLSIQVHPTRAQALSGFERESEVGIPTASPSRTYRDRNHKPELVVALGSEFVALVGLCDTHQALERLDEFGATHSTDALRTLLTRAVAAGDYRSVLEWVFSDEGQPTVETLVAEFAAHDRAGLSADAASLVDVAMRYPGDPGVVLSLLMNRVVLQEGQAIHVRPGTLHAYLSGLALEVMASSDNVVRGGLTPKHVDRGELLRIADTNPSRPDVVTLVPRSAASVMEFDDAEDFALTACVAPLDRYIPVGGPAVAVVTHGEVTFAAQGTERTLRAGQAMLVTPACHGVTASGPGTAFVVQPAVTDVRRHGGAR